MLVDQAFGGNSFAASRLIRRLERNGYVESRRVGAGRYGYQVFSLTGPGAQWLFQRRETSARRRRSRRSPSDDQVFCTGFGDPRQVRHDQRVAEAAAEEISGIEAAGGRVRRVRLDPELRSLLASASESARTSSGPRAARTARLDAARKAGLRVFGSRAPIPDVLIEFEDASGRVEHRAVEVVTSSYSGKQVAEKRRAGFSIYMPSQGSSGRSAAARGITGPGSAFPADWGGSR